MEPNEPKKGGFSKVFKFISFELIIIVCIGLGIVLIINAFNLLPKSDTSQQTSQSNAFTKATTPSSDFTPPIPLSLNDPSVQYFSLVYAISGKVEDIYPSENKDSLGRNFSILIIDYEKKHPEFGPLILDDETQFFYGPSANNRDQSARRPATLQDIKIGDEVLVTASYFVARNQKAWYVGSVRIIDPSLDNQAPTP